VKQEYGLKKFYVSRIKSEPEKSLPVYETGMMLEELAKATVNLTFVKGESYGDNKKFETPSEFSSGTCTIETLGMTAAQESYIYGSRLEEGTLVRRGNDQPPLVGFAFYTTLYSDKTKKTTYEAHFFPKASAVPGNDDYSTKGSSITLKNKQTTFNLFLANNDAYEIKKEFDSESDADAYCRSVLNIGEYYEINIVVSGSGKVTPKGTAYAAAGEDFVMAIEGAPAKVYDNGADVTSSVAGGQYVIAGVDGPHNIAVIFA